MGGYGSGRPGWHGKVEDHRFLDITRMRQRGVLKPGYYGGWKWSIDGEEVASIGLRSEESRVHLFYTLGGQYSERIQVNETVTLTRTACTLGGARPWFICPGVVDGRACNRRVGKLYLGSKYFVCRHCMNLKYASQSEDPHYRLLRRADKLRMALGGDPGTASPYPRKPKGMHWATYWRKIDAIDRYDHLSNLSFIRWARAKFPGVCADDLFH